MGAEQAGICVHHLRLEPQTKQQPQSVYLFRQACKAAGQLFAVDGVIAQALCVIVPCAKPSVVQHEQLRPQLRRALCQ